jgi:hypothetical protein
MRMALWSSIIRPFKKNTKNSKGKKDLLKLQPHKINGGNRPYKALRLLSFLSLVSSLLRLVFSVSLVSTRSVLLLRLLLLQNPFLFQHM